MVQIVINETAAATRNLKLPRTRACYPLQRHLRWHEDYPALSLSFRYMTLCRTKCRDHLRLDLLETGLVVPEFSAVAMPSAMTGTLVLKMYLLQLQSMPRSRLSVSLMHASKIIALLEQEDPSGRFSSFHVRRSVKEYFPLASCIVLSFLHGYTVQWMRDRVPDRALFCCFLCDSARWG